MNRPTGSKSTVNEIRARFDNDVERFSNLETGQSATIDGPLAMELITRSGVGYIFSDTSMKLGKPYFTGI